MLVSLLNMQSALGWDHQEQLSKHESQTDAAKGFGGKYGVQKESQDKVECTFVILKKSIMIMICDSIECSWMGVSE